MTSAPFAPPSSDWEARIDALWDRARVDGSLDGPDLVAAVGALAAELPEEHPVGLFEVGGSYDSTGDPETAVRYYRAALAGGLDASRRRQCVIQLASSLRNLGAAEESADLVLAELALGGTDLEPQLRAFAALVLADVGREREAVGLAVGAVGLVVERYSRSLTAYGAALADGLLNAPVEAAQVRPRSDP